MKFVTAILVILLAAPSVFALEYPVVWNLGNDYSSWADRPLTANDTLLFTYSNAHNLLVVNRGDYDNCAPSNPITSHTDGRTVIPLTPGPMYFICGIGNHCTQGMRLQVNVSTSASGGTTPSSTAGTPPSSSTPAGSNGATGLSMATHVMFGLPLALGTFLAFMA